MAFPNNVVPMLNVLFKCTLSRLVSVEIYHCYFPLHKPSVQINVATSKEVVYHRQLSS